MDEGRANVMLTRSQHLLVVVGDAVNMAQADARENRKKLVPAMARWCGAQGRIFRHEEDDDAPAVRPTADRAVVGRSDIDSGVTAASFLAAARAAPASQPSRAAPAVASLVPFHLPAQSGSRVPTAALPTTTTVASVLAPAAAPAAASLVSTPRAVSAAASTLPRTALAASPPTPLSPEMFAFAQRVYVLLRGIRPPGLLITHIGIAIPAAQRPGGSATLLPLLRRVPGVVLSLGRSGTLWRALLNPSPVVVAAAPADAQVRPVASVSPPTAARSTYVPSQPPLSPPGSRGATSAPTIYAGWSSPPAVRSVSAQASRTVVTPGLIPASLASAGWSTSMVMQQSEPTAAPRAAHVVQPPAADHSVQLATTADHIRSASLETAIISAVAAAGASGILAARLGEILCQGGHVVPRGGLEQLVQDMIDCGVSVRRGHAATAGAHAIYFHAPPVRSPSTALLPDTDSLVVIAIRAASGSVVTGSSLGQFLRALVLKGAAEQPRGILRHIVRAMIDRGAPLVESSGAHGQFSYALCQPAAPQRRP